MSRTRHLRTKASGDIDKIHKGRIRCIIPANPLKFILTLAILLWLNIDERITTTQYHYPRQMQVYLFSGLTDVSNSVNLWEYIVVFM